MAVEITIFHKNSGEILEIIYDLKRQGIIVGEDFEFAFNTTVYDEKNEWKVIKDMHTVFTFKSEKYATLFALKYA